MVSLSASKTNEIKDRKAMHQTTVAKLTLAIGASKKHLGRTFKSHLSHARRASTYTSQVDRNQQIWDTLKSSLEGTPFDQS